LGAETSCPRGKDGDYFPRSYYHILSIRSVPSNRTNRYRKRIMRRTGNKLQRTFQKLYNTFRHVNKRNNTELSKHAWKVKDAKKPFNKHGKFPENASLVTTQLSNAIQNLIICRKDLCGLNKRNEIATSCSTAGMILDATG